MISHRYEAALLAAILLTVLLLAAIVIADRGVPTIGPPPTPTRPPETLIPTPVGAQSEYNPRLDRTFDVAPQPMPEPYTLRWRIGIGVPDANPLYFDWPAHRPGWFLNWRAGHQLAPSPQVLASFPMEPVPGLGMTFAPMVRLYFDQLRPSPRELRLLAARYPGQIWLIGNEPDVPWQDGVRPERYVEMYHEAYQAITSVDPTARVAIGGISQVTPLRLTYLDTIWQGYREQYGEEMPVDIWNMHAFVLREEAGNWGVGIPPGFEHVSQGVLWDIEDHDNLMLVEQQVRLMRAWMKEHGQQDKPLYITEYGILMPEQYGFPPSRVIDFLLGSFDLFRSLKDENLGYPADEHRLVQRWVWFSTRDRLYPTGDLFDMEGNPTPLARAINGYIRTNIAGADDRPSAIGNWDSAEHTGGFKPTSLVDETSVDAESPIVDKKEP